jgi:N-acetylmuramate 1-kinase
MALDSDTMTSSVFETTISRLIAQAGFEGAVRDPLAQDASTRSYERIYCGDRSAILMKAPPGNEGANPPCPPDAEKKPAKHLAGTRCHVWPPRAWRPLWRWAII